MTDEFCWTYQRYTHLYTAAVNELYIDPKAVLRWRWTRYGHALECPICQAYQIEIKELAKQANQIKNLWYAENDREDEK